MAIAVASTSITNAGVANPVSITKPTGVTVGDLLVIVAAGEQSGSVGSTFYASVSGFTAAIQLAGGVRNGFINPDTNLVYLYRIADSSDVSASSYSISNAEGGAAMFRITGWTSGNPFSHKSTVEYTGSVTAISKTENIPRIRQQLLIMAGSNETEGTPRTGSGYTITSSNANPTWTEVVDTGGGGTKGAGLQVAYAISSDLSTITAWQYTLNDTIAGVAGALAIITEPQNATGDVSHNNVTPSIEGVTASQVNVGPVDVSHVSIIPTVEGVNTKSSSAGTQWTNPDKPTTNWDNLPKQ